MVLASVDRPEVQLALDRTWHVPFRWVGDPGGARVAEPLGACDEEE